MDALADFLQRFSLVFLPLFVAMDPLGNVAFLVPVLGAARPHRRRRVVHLALATGLVIGMVFLALGQGIFVVLGITVSDFLIAGGLILLVVSLRELLSSTTPAPTTPTEMMAVVPIGTPLLVGPATVSMLILLSGLHGYGLVILGFLANILVAWVVFINAERILGFLGKGGLLAFSKVAYLLLAAIAVQLIRRGLTEVLPQVLGR